MAKGKPLMVESIELPVAGARGVAIGRMEDGRALMAKGAVPGDTAKVRITKKKKSHWMGEVVEVLQPSSDRVAPQCAHFQLCGGCVWQNMQYDAQLRWKAQEVRENLRRLGGVEVEEELPIIPSQETFYYRNKLEYSFTAERWLDAAEVASNEEIADRRACGFHIPGRWDRVFEVHHCWLQPEPSNAIRNSISAWSLQHNWTFYHPRERKGWLRSMMIRNTLDGQFMVMIQTGHREEKARAILTENLLEHFPQIRSLYFAVNDKANDSLYHLDMELVAGEAGLVEEMPAYAGGKPLQFRIGPKSFYQTNPKQASNLYRVALDWAEVNENSLVYDLYTGTGTIALYLAQKAGKVVGIEGVPEAVVDAEQNARENGVHNVSFFAGDMRKVLNSDFVQANGQPDVVVTDPPREGMHPDVVQSLIALAAPRIVYVSCNSATQARDLALMKDHYRVVKSRAVDMFPHTAHVENVVLLQHR